MPPIQPEDVHTTLTIWEQLKNTPYELVIGVIAILASLLQIRLIGKKAATKAQIVVPIPDACSPKDEHMYVTTKVFDEFKNDVFTKIDTNDQHLATRIDELFIAIAGINK